jgi:hypothetical protein
VSQVSETELTIRFKNGSVIQLKGASEPDTLRGRNLKFVVLDEYGSMPKELWPQVIRPQLSDRGKEGDALFIGSPHGYTHFKALYDEERAGTKGPEWQAWHFTSLDGENIAAREIIQAKNDLSLRDFRQEYLATFESIEGRVYHSFVREFFPLGNLDSSVDDPGPGLSIWIGVYFNVAPLSAILCSKRLITRDKVMKTYDDDGNEISRRHYELHVWKEYQLYDCGTAELMQAIRNDFPARPLIVFPDPTGDSRKTSAPVGQTDFTIIRSFGANIFVPRFRTNSDKYNHVNGLLCNTVGIRRLLINPRTCPRLVESLDGLQIKDGTNFADKNSGFCTDTAQSALSIFDCAATLGR